MQVDESRPEQVRVFSECGARRDEISRLAALLPLLDDLSELLEGRPMPVFPFEECCQFPAALSIWPRWKRAVLDALSLMNS